MKAWPPIVVRLQYEEQGNYRSRTYWKVLSLFGIDIVKWCTRWA